MAATDRTAALAMQSDDAESSPFFQGHPLRILHVMAGGKEGGAETMFLEGILALAETPVQQYVVTRSNNRFRLQKFAEAGIPTVIASFGNWLRWSTTRKLKKAIADFDPDIVHHWMGRAGTYSMPSRACNIAWYGGYYKCSRFKHCTHHIGVTKDLVRHIAEQGVPEDRIGLVHTFSEFDDLTPVPRSTFDTPDNVPLLIALGRLHSKKAFDILLKALTRLPCVYLWLAGEGPIENELKNLSTSLGLDDRVRFLGWRNDRGNLLATGDICVFPSRYEPFGTVTVDAWATDTPLVAAKAVGPKTYIEHEKTGLLVEIDDVAGLAAAIDRLVRDETLRARLIAGGREAYHNQFTKKCFIRDCLGFYQKALSGA